jgi:hypothetical protein
MTREEKARVLRHLKSEASSPKSRLMDILRELERIGAHGDAKTLGSLIGRLEAWQCRP